MEILLGFILSFLTILFVKKFILTDNLMSSSSIPTIRYSQSYLFDLVSPTVSYVPLQKYARPSQSYLNDQKNKQRIIFTDDKAYWIKDNAFYEAAIVDGEVDKTTTKVVDTMTMDKVELDKMIFIVEKITEGTRNDFGNPGIA